MTSMNHRELFRAAVSKAAKESAQAIRIGRCIFTMKDGRPDDRSRVEYRSVNQAKAAIRTGHYGKTVAV